MKNSTVPLMMLLSVLAAAPAHAADIAAGKAKAEESCADCHGDEGAGDDTYPSIAGMPVERFEQAMREYRDGTRTESRQMIKVTKKLSDADIADLAAYYATFD